VCAGLSYYLNLVVVLVRVIIILLFHFGFSGLLIYLLCWFIIPEARTKSQRLEMKGEATYYEETPPSGDNFLVVLGRFVFSLIVASVGILIFLILLVVLAVLFLVGMANIQQADWYFQLYDWSGPSLSTIMTIGMLLSLAFCFCSLRWFSHRHAQCQRHLVVVINRHHFMVNRYGYGNLFLCAVVSSSRWSMDISQSSVSSEEVRRLKQLAAQIRKRIIEIIFQANSGHTGGSLSATDMLVVLFFHVMHYQPDQPDWPDRDRFILSKGHSVESLYCTLAKAGFMEDALLDTYGSFGTPLVGHPTRKIPGIEVNSGALGHGLSFGVGLALAAQLDPSLSDICADGGW
jgi:phage shock protein PspC (stress-responsive transcriptional regulator)